MEQRQIIQQDPAQVKSINAFTDSLAKALAEADGLPSKELTRELLADGLRRALDVGGELPKKHFLEILAANIHKFALQEQYSLSRVYPVEISSEYKNLQSFFSDGAEDVAGHARARGGEPPALMELRRRLTALPATPGPAAEELVTKLKEEQTSQALKAVDARTRTAFFAEVRVNLHRLTEGHQKELLERFGDLKTEVVKLVDSLTQEISVWLDEERVASTWQNFEKQASLVAQAQKLFQAMLSDTFQVSFRHIGGVKRAKEAFLLQTAVCLKTGAEKHYWQPPVSDLAAKLRRSFFFVEGYGELMEDWMQQRRVKLNEEFVQRATSTLSTNFQEVLSRLRQIFRPGRWMFVLDPRVEGDLISLLLDESFPRHVLSTQSISRLLEMVGSYGGDDFHIYNEIARLPPLRQPPSAGPQDLTEAALLELLRRLPGFGFLPRLGAGRYRFGSLEVLFHMTGTELAAQVIQPPSTEVMRAVDFFSQRGPQEFPSAALDAVKASDALGLAPTMTIQDGSMPSFGMALAPSLGAPALGAPLGGPSLGAPSLGAPSLGAPSLGAPSLGAPLLGAPSLGAPLLGAPLLGAPFAPAWPKYGIEDDEI
ncbi:unnamed protein product [Effrenium voratum]|uniref:Uncharacterized protein n=1 Tax=Effrenium voratum TaxID=2562239 RepID=A0AA36IGX9_9DINO|nr:unnamed protein product [Effrenium voratum]CAJ1455214.1 unnamed protein product [Effrenium voratum]